MVWNEISRFLQKFFDEKFEKKYKSVKIFQNRIYFVKKSEMKKINEIIRITFITSIRVNLLSLFEIISRDGLKQNFMFLQKFFIEKS